jgi:hypothetical protein
LETQHVHAALDAEEWRDFVGAHFKGASAAVTEMGGKGSRATG